MNQAKWQTNNSSLGGDALFIGLAALVVFMFGIWQQPFINFETRFAVFAQEMLRHGVTLFPTTYGQPYPDYPVTSTVLIWLFSLPFGEVTKFSAVLPTALASAWIVALTYQLFALYSKKWGVLAVGFEFLTLTFLAESRSISVDQMVSAITLTAFYLTHKSYRDDVALPTKRLVLLLIAGFLVRGPIGVVIPAGVVFSHLMLTSERRVVVAFAAWSAGTLVACTAVLLGLAMLVYGREFVNDILRMQAVSRFSESVPSPRYYYFTSSFGNYALSYPMAVIAAVGLLINKFRKKVLTCTKPHALIVTLLLAWAAIVLVGLSIPETKKIRYILPVVPALAGLAGYIFIDTENPFMKWGRWLVKLVLIALPVLATVLLYTQKNRLERYGLDLGFAKGICIFLSLASLSAVVFFKKQRTDVSVALLFVGALTAIFLNATIVEPVNLSIHDTSQFVQRVESLQDKQPGRLVFYKENPDGSAIKYLVNARKEILPEFISELQGLKGKREPVWLLTKAGNIEDLERAGITEKSVVYHERFGDLPYLIVFIPAFP